MKNLKTIIFSVFIVLLTFTSCTNDDTTINTNNIESPSIKAALAELRTHFTENGALDPTENPVGNILFDFCFDFVYPITLNYNTGANVTVNDLNELVALILGSTDTLFVNGISFPFQVETYEDGEIVISTINSEQECNELIQSCDFNNPDCDCTDDYDPVCVIVIAVNDQPFTLEFPNACFAQCYGFTQNDFVDCEGNGNPIGDYDCFEYNYPISLVYQNETVIINSKDEFEIFMYNNNVDFQFVYPFDVTVVLPNGSSHVLTINNEAEYIALLESCEGVDDDCEISNVTVVSIECIDFQLYDITLDFDVENPVGDIFDLYDSNGVFLQHFGINDLPLTVSVTGPPSIGGNSFSINMNDNPSCSTEVSWTEPNCE